MSKILDDLAVVLGANGLLLGDDVAARPQNWMGHGSRQAKAIMRPQTTEELSQVLKICNDAHQSVIALGGMTGLVDGTASTNDDVLLSLERMNAVEDIDTLGKTAIVQAGAPLQKVQEAADGVGLQFALDLGARGSCTIGGNIATNAGGNQVLRFGMMREQVLGLEAVLADGTVLGSMNSLLKNNTGYDLKHLFVGSEGTLGVVTRAVLRLHPKAKSQDTALIAASSFENVTKLLGHMQERLAGGLVAFEVMWHDHYKMIAVDSGRHQAPIAADYGYYVVVEQQGADPNRDAERFAAALESAFELELIEDAVLAQSEAQAQSIWDIREDIEGLMMALTPAFIFDVSLPIKHMDKYISNLHTKVREQYGEGAHTIVFGHLGDGNLHIGVSVGDDSEAVGKNIKGMVYAPLQAIGGSVSAEHGIGLEKKDYLNLSRTETELAVMKRLKVMFDPNNILNPNKIF